MSPEFSNLRSDISRIKKDLEFRCEVGKIFFGHKNVTKLKGIHYFNTYTLYLLLVFTMTNKCTIIS